MSESEMTTKVLDRWVKQHESTQGHYCHFAGFEADLKCFGTGILGTAYDKLNIYEQIALFAFVADLLCEEAGE